MSKRPFRVSITTPVQAALVLLCLAAQCAFPQSTGSISGAVADPSGAAVAGAVITVEAADGSRHTTVSENDGTFRLSSLPLGQYRVKVSAARFADWTRADVPASAADANPLAVVLDLAPNLTALTVGVGPEAVASAQVHQELQQRALGVIPNYYVSYEPHSAPLTSSQKLHLGVRSLVDPITFGLVGLTAGIEQDRNSYFQFGQGLEGYAKRYAGSYISTASGILVTAVLMDSVLHQDPRYFYAGRAFGNRPRRALYAVEAAFRVKGDNGNWQPPYSDLIGVVAAAEISNAYYPGSRTQYTLLGRGLMFHFAGRVALNLAQELLLKQVTTNSSQSQALAGEPVLREGTPVPLIAVDGLAADGMIAGQTVTFVLAQDLSVGGQVVAKTGDLASGQVDQVRPGNAPDQAAQVGLGRVTLRAGAVSVPLRSSPMRGVAGPMQYQQLPDSGKIQVTLYVAETTRFPQSR